MRHNSRKKIRKSTRYFYMFIATVLLIISAVYLYSAFFINNVNTSKTNIYTYSNNFNSSYKVKLIDNNYINKSYLDMGQVYVTDLIDYISLDLNYTYDATEKSNLTYSYEVIGVLNATYTLNDKEETIWQKEYSILPLTTDTITDSGIVINETIDLNLKDQNSLVKSFQDNLSINIKANYNVLLKVYTNTDFNNDNLTNAYENTISIDLGKRVTQVAGTFNDKTSNSITKDITANKSTNIFAIVLNAIILIASFITLRRLQTKTTTSNILRNEYKLELNKILRICQDKIVEVNSTLEINRTQLIDVKDFGEIIKVSEELYKPILHWASTEKEESWFCVMSNNVTYRYILNKEIL